MLGSFLFHAQEDRKTKGKKKTWKKVATSEAPVKGKKSLWIFDAWDMAGGLLEWAQGPCFQSTDPGRESCEPSEQQQNSS